VTVAVFVSLRGAPGVTTAVLATAAGWPAGRRVRLVEADPAGGVLAVRYHLDPSRGIGSLAAARRTTHDPLEEHSQQLPGGVPVLSAPVAADHTTSSLTAVAGRLATLLAAVGEADVVVDGGRVWPGSPVWQLAAAADVLGVVIRPVPEEISAVYARRDTLSRVGPAVRVITVGSRPYPPDDIAATLQLPVSTLADDSKAAAALAGRGRVRDLARTALVRSARDLADTLTTTKVDDAPAHEPPRPSMAAMASREPTP